MAGTTYSFESVETKDKGKNLARDGATKLATREGVKSYQSWNGWGGWILLISFLKMRAPEGAWVCPKQSGMPFYPSYYCTWGYSISNPNGMVCMKKAYSVHDFVMLHHTFSASIGWNVMSCFYVSINHTKPNGRPPMWGGDPNNNGNRVHGEPQDTDSQKGTNVFAVGTQNILWVLNTNVHTLKAKHQTPNTNHQKLRKVRLVHTTIHSLCPTSRRWKINPKDVVVMREECAWTVYVCGFHIPSTIRSEWEDTEEGESTFSVTLYIL